MSSTPERLPKGPESAVRTRKGLDLFDGLIIVFAIVVFVVCGSLIFSKDFRTKGSNAGSTGSNS